jgi:lysine biosynthesis protein LysW
MALKVVKNDFAGECPVCEALVVSAPGVEESEVISCPDCQSLLVVDAVQENSLTLEEAPLMEEDWGE